MILSRAGEVEGDICISERDRVTPGGWLQRSRGFFGPWTLQAPCLSFPIQTVCDAPVGEQCQEITSRMWSCVWDTQKELNQSSKELSQAWGH